MRYNHLRDVSHIIIDQETAGHFHLLSPPLIRTIHKRFEYCVVLDTLAVYDSAVPESRAQNIRELEKLRKEALKLGEDDEGSEKLKGTFDELEKALWEEVGSLSRYVAAENTEMPARRRPYRSSGAS